MLVEQPSKTETILRKIFFITLFLRFCYVIYYDPSQQLWSDPLRHWNNGIEFLKFTYNSGLDPKLYQLFLTILRGAFKDDMVLISMVVGLLAVGVAHVWYKVAQELFYPNEKKALIFGIIFSVIPTLLCIFSFFFNETLLVYVIGLGTYLSLKSYREPTNKNFIRSIIVWGLASAAKLTALPMALIAVCFSLRMYEKKVRLFLLAVVILAFFIILCCLQTYKSANIFSPAYTIQMNKIYNKSGYQTIRYEVIFENGGGAVYVWSSGSFYMDFLSPFGKYQTHRKNGVYDFKIDTRNGSKDWNELIEKLSNEQSIKDKVMNYYENFVFLTLAGSWPDMNQARFYERLNYDLRYMWPPIIVIILLFSFSVKAPSKEIFVVITAYIMLILFITQDVGIMEARYRKAIEPHLLFSIYIILSRLFSKNNNSGETIFTYCWNSLVEYKYLLSKFVKNKETGGDDKGKADEMIPL